VPSLRDLSNLPEEVDALTVASLYIERWRIEKMFQVITDNFNCEIKTLGYPRAALFVFCMAMIAFNILSVIRGAMKEVHGEEKMEAELSNYYVAKEVQRNFSGMEIAVTPEEWKEFNEMSETEFAEHLKDWAKKVELQKFRSSPRGEKKPVKKEKFNKKNPHIVTFRLLSSK
jgi:hypothetical protein